MRYSGCLGGIPQLGHHIPAETLRRFWTMLAHNQGGLLHAAA